MNKLYNNSLPSIIGRIVVNGLIYLQVSAWKATSLNIFTTDYQLDSRVDGLPLLPILHRKFRTCNRHEVRKVGCIPVLEGEIYLVISVGLREVIPP